MYSQTLKHLVTINIIIFISIQQKYLVFSSFQKDSEESCTKKIYSQKCFTNTNYYLLYMILKLMTQKPLQYRSKVRWQSLETFKMQSLIPKTSSIEAWVEFHNVHGLSRNHQGLLRNFTDKVRDFCRENKGLFAWLFFSLLKACTTLLLWCTFSSLAPFFTLAVILEKETDYYV